MVARGRVAASTRDGEPVRILGTVVDVTDARRQAAPRLSAVQRAAAIAEVAAELANATGMEQLAEIVLRGAQVLGAQSSALAVFDAGGGPLRLHMTSRAHRRGPQRRDVELPGRRHRDRARRRRCRPSTRPVHGRRVLLADREEAARPLPGHGGGLDGPRPPARSRRCRCASRAACSAASSPLWTTEHPFAADDVEVLEALDRADRAERLAAAGRRRARTPRSPR